MQTPDKISFKELQDLMANAEASAPEEYECLTPSEVCAKAKEIVDNIEKCDDLIMIHKVMVLMILRRFYDFHTQMADKAMEDNDKKNAFGWHRDAGKLQAINQVLCEIQLCEEDFTCSED